MNRRPSQSASIRLTHAVIPWKTWVPARPPRVSNDAKPVQIGVKPVSKVSKLRWCEVFPSANAPIGNDQSATNGCSISVLQYVKQREHFALRPARSIPNGDMYNECSRGDRLLRAECGTLCVHREGREMRILPYVAVVLLTPFAAFHAAALQASEPEVKLAVFNVDATPPVGSEMAYDPVKRLDEMTLRCRGIVLLGPDKPIVLCAVDWIGIANEGHDAFCDALAEAAGTTRDRVAVHTLHQHDAPECDFTAERIVRELKLTKYGRYDGTFHREVIRRAADTLRAAWTTAQPVTHYGWGVAEVKEIASNRRILGSDGRVRAERYTATKDPALRAEPEGVIDPQLSLLILLERRPAAGRAQLLRLPSAELLSHRRAQPGFPRHRAVHSRPSRAGGPARPLQRRRRQHRRGQIQRRRQGEPHGARPAPGGWNEAGLGGDEAASAGGRPTWLGDRARAAAGGRAFGRGKADCGDQDAARPRPHCRGRPACLAETRRDRTGH